MVRGDELGDAGDPVEGLDLAELRDDGGGGGALELRCPRAEVQVAPLLVDRSASQAMERNLGRWGAKPAARRDSSSPDF